MGKNERWLENGNGHVFDLKRYGKRGYDYKESFDDDGREYEMYCFEMLANQIGNHDIIFGPNITNHGFAQSSLRRAIRPDMLHFTIHQAGRWELLSMIECKQSRKLDIPLKLRGFSDLTRQLRKNPQALREALKTYRGGMEIPRVIEVPQDKHLSVVFCAPDISNAISYPRSEFQVVYQKVRKDNI